MTDLQSAFLSIGCKSTLILGIVTVLACIADVTGRMRARSGNESVWWPY